QTRYRVGELRTLVLPVIDPVERKAQAFFTVARDRVVEAHALDEPPVAPIARVRNDDVEERSLLGAATSQSDHYHCDSREKRKDVDYRAEKRLVARFTKA